MSAPSTIDPIANCFNCNKQVDIYLLDVFPHKMPFCSHLCYQKYSLIKRNTTKFTSLHRICTTCNHSFWKKPFTQVGDSKYFCKRQCFHRWLDINLEKFRQAMSKSGVFIAQRKMDLHTKKIYG